MTQLFPFYENRECIPLGIDALCPVIDGERYDFVLERLRSRNNLQRRKRNISGGMVHDHYHIVMYPEGEARISICDKVVACPAGSVVLSGPGEKHNLIPPSGGYRSIALTFHFQSNGRRLYLPFHKVLSRLTCTNLPQMQSPVQLSPHNADRLRLCFERLQERMLDRASPVWAFRVSVAFWQLVEIVIDAIYCPRIASLRQPNKRLERVRTILKTQFRERFSVDQLAGVAGMSKGYFLRAFKREYGIPPIAYQLQLRMEEAKRLLISTEMQIQEIAAEVGFDSIYYFSRMFKAAASCSPTQYRQSDDL